MYRADPVAPWLEYDLSPSVFSQPRAPADAGDAPPLDPALDSVFTQRAPRAHPPAFSSNIDFGPPPAEGAPAPEPAPLPRTVFPQDHRPPQPRPQPMAMDTIAQVLDWSARAAARTAELAGTDDRIGALCAEVEALDAQVAAAADALTGRRRQAAVELAERTTQELAHLAMGSARVEVAVRHLERRGMLAATEAARLRRRDGAARPARGAT